MTAMDKRYTSRDKISQGVLRLKQNEEDWKIVSNSGGWDYKIMGNAVDRLADYEDTGLTPEEVEKMKSEYSETFQAHLQYLLDCKDNRIKQLETECRKLNKLINETLMRCKRAEKRE